MTKERQKGLWVLGITLAIVALLFLGLQAVTNNRKLASLTAEAAQNSCANLYKLPNLLIRSPKDGKQFDYGQTITVTACGQFRRSFPPPVNRVPLIPIALSVDGVVIVNGSCFASIIGPADRATGLVTTAQYICRITADTYNLSPGPHSISANLDGRIVSSVTISVITATNSGAIPSGGFSVLPQSGAAPLAVTAQFDLGSSCSKYTLTWGDGTNSSSPGASDGLSCSQVVVQDVTRTHTYTSGGTYTVSFQSGGSVTATQTVTVTGDVSPPDGPVTICNNDGVVEVCAPSFTVDGSVAVTAHTLSGQNAQRIFMYADGVKFKTCQNVPTCTYTASVYAQGPHAISATTVHPLGNSGPITVTKQ
jgi:hypothetical protein